MDEDISPDELISIEAQPLMDKMAPAIHDDLVELHAIREELAEAFCELGVSDEAVVSQFISIPFAGDLASRWEEAEAILDEKFTKAMVKVDKRVNEWLDFDGKVMSAVCSG